MWLLPAAGLIALAAVGRRERSERGGYLVLGALLWTLSAVMFVFTKYPWGLQLYYSHFSVIGLTLFAALSVAGAQNGLDALACRGKMKPFRLAALRWSAVALMAAWFALADGTNSVLDPKASLAGAVRGPVFQGRLSISSTVGFKTGRTVASCFSTPRGCFGRRFQYGEMIPAMFPGVEVACDGRDGFRWSETERTPPATLVVRQTGERSFRVVR